MHLKKLIINFLLVVGTCHLPITAEDAEGREFTLDTLEEAVMVANPELRYYEYEIEAAKQGSKVAGRLQNPNLNAQVGQWVVDDQAGSTADGLAWSVSALQPIEFPKRLALKKAIANRDIAMAEVGLEHFKALLSERTRTLGFKLFTFQKRAEAADEVAERVQALQAVMVQRDPAGITPLLETRILESAVLRAQKQAGDARLEERKLTVALNQLMGEWSDQPIRVSMGALSFESLPDTGSLLTSAYENDFGIRMREIELEQQGFKVKLQKSKQNPIFSVGPYFGQQEAGGKETTAGIGLSVNIPIWNNGKAKTEIERIRLRQAEASMEMMRREVAEELMLTQQTYTVRLNSMQKWREGAEERFREAAALGNRHYQLGAIDISTYVALQTAFVEAMNTLLETQEEAYTSHLRIKTLTGSDFVLEADNKP